MLKYICISDLHAGSLTSLLTDHSGKGKPDPNAISPLTEAFGNAFGAFVQAARGSRRAKPQLILLGDVLDLQFSRRRDATSNALGFLKTISPHVSGNVIATAGNHDHALWTDARLDLFAKAFTATPEMPDYREATPAFQASGAESRLLSAVLTSAGFNKCDFRYPNLGFSNEKRAVLLHHGHFAEGLYRTMSHLIDFLEGRQRSTLSVEAISAENGGWIDFLWSAIGEARFGQSAEELYQNFLTTTGSRQLTRRWAAQIAGALGEKLPMAGNLVVQDTIHALTLAALDQTLGKYRDSERYTEVMALSTDGLEGLKWYLEGPCLDQLRRELVGDDKPFDDLPEDITFVLGHTHKPFAKRVAADGYKAALKVYNTGGWTLNGPRLDNAEGAAMVLIDENLNTASVRLFSTPRNGKSEPAFVEVLSDGPEAEKFADEIRGWLKKSKPEWSTLARKAKTAYERRQALLIELTSAQTEAAQ